MSEPTPVVRLKGPDGRLVEADASDVNALVDSGRYAVADANDEAAFLQRQEYGDQGGRAFLEGAGRGASLGLSDYVQAEGAALGTQIGNYAADLAGYGPTEQAVDGNLDAAAAPIDRFGDEEKAFQESRADLLGRQQANGVAATGGELLGGLGLGLATGGLGTAGLAARGSTALGRAGYAALAGGLEGAAYGAAKAADDDFLNDRDITVERILLGAGEGAILGGALGGGASLLGSGVKYAAGKAADALGGASGLGGWLDNLAGESAYKAVTGRTSKASIKAADRHGGAAAVGKTVFDAGIDLTADAETILAQTTAAADDAGSKLGLLAKEADDFGGGGPSRSGLKAAIEERVLKPLSEGTFSEGTEATVRAKLGKLMDKLSAAESPVLVRSGKATRALPEAANDIEAELVKGLEPRAAGVERALDRDSITFGELRDIRREIDDELANWNKLTAEQGPLKAYRDVRRVMEEYWLDSAEDAAKKAGRDGFAEQVIDLKRKYSHLALARDQAQEAVTTQLANRATSLSDTLAGVGTAGGVGGPLGMVAGIASSQAHKLARERGRGYLATAIYRARKAAVKGEEGLEKAAKGLLTGAKSGSVAPRPLRAVDSVPIAGVILSPGDAASYEGALQHLLKLQDAASNERRKLQEQNAELAAESPEHAAAIDAHVQRTADFLVDKAGPSGADVSRPFANLRKPKHDRGKAQTLARYARAAQNPQAALGRVSDGTYTREDLETLQELYPRLWARFGGKVRAELATLEKPPTYKARLALSQVLGQPMTAFDTPAFQEIMNASRGTSDQAEAEAQAQMAGPGQQTVSPSNVSVTPLMRGNVYAGSDRAIARGE